MRPATGQPPIRSARRGGSPYPRADLALRLLAKSADLLVAVLFVALVPTVGSLLALAYLLFVDGMPNGQSPGKRLMGVKAVHVPTRQGCNLRQSVVRNLPVAIAFGFAINPFLLLVAIPVGLFELYMVVTDPLGVRIGDVFADTQVIDGKVPLESTVPQEQQVVRRSVVPLSAPGVD